MDAARLAFALVREEGIRLKPYRDSVGVWTVGVGHNLESGGISRAAAMQILEDDIANVCRDLDARLPWWRTLDEVRQQVVADMAFNLGVSGLLGFKNTLGFVKQKRWNEAAAGMLVSLWAKQVGRRATVLAEMMRTGVDPFDGVA